MLDGCTLAVVQLENGEARPYHIGDAQILQVGSRGKIKLFTTSHSPVGYAFQSGYLDEQEAIVSAENWHEERDRLVRLLKAIESGKVTHVDEEDMRELQATTPENIEALKKRLAELNDRLGPK